MTDVSASTRGSGRTGRKRDQGGNPVSRFFRSISLFISQILDELRKVVRPTREELVNYTVVVIIFVSVIMGIVAAIDFGFTKLVLWVFGG
ncbi:MAG TPA: preprotein translocase subunit SecE [Pedococcus sp.]|jgi:preprotein translocase subunit SecE|nr:preprotein translocase subunit SecE [Pedococcus sp.]